MKWGMYMLEKVEGIVLKTQNYGETHKIITVYSKEIGKFSAICRGANKPRSRFSSLAQPFIQGQFLIYLSKGLSTVQQGDILHSFRHIREDIVKTAYASYTVELFDKLTETKERDSFLYEQLVLTLKRISEENEPIIPIIMLELKLYKNEGFAPQVDYCTNCKQHNFPFYFSIREGGLLCQKCYAFDEHAILLPNSIVKLLPIFLNIGLERIGRIDVKKNNQQLLRRIFDAYYDQYGGYYLKSKRFLSQLDLLNE